MENTVVSLQADQTISELIEILSTLSPEQLNIKNAPDVWSPAQIGEHLLKSYGVADVLRGNTKPTERAFDEKIDQIKGIFLNFDTKLQSPEFIIPTLSFIDKNYLLEGLKDKKDALIKNANSLDLTLTCTDFVLPGLGELTRFEWISFVIFHTQRHLFQLKNTIKQLELQA